MKVGTGLQGVFWEHGLAKDCPIYDMHGHMGPHNGIYFPYADPGLMVRRMERAGVKLLAFSHHTALSSPAAGNSLSLEAARKYPGRLKAYCVINPNYPDLAERELEGYERCSDAYIGFKLHPDLHKTRLSGDGYGAALTYADEKSLPVLTHTWAGSPHCGEKEARKTAETYPDVKLILGHSLHGAWERAAALAAEFPNVYLDLCAVIDQRAGILERFVSVAGSEKILFGTDFPWFSHHYYIGGVLAADIEDEDRRNIFYRNARKLIYNPGGKQ